LGLEIKGTIIEVKAKLVRLENRIA
jgi:hypothetical protein